MIQLVAIHPDNRETIINTTQDIAYLDQIVEDRGGTVWLGSDLCDLKVQVIK